MTITMKKTMVVVFIVVVVVIFLGFVVVDFDVSSKVYLLWSHRLVY